MAPVTIIKNHLFCEMSSSKGYCLGIRSKPEFSDEPVVLTRPILVDLEQIEALPHSLPLPAKIAKAHSSALQLKMSLNFKKELTLEQDFVQLIEWPQMCLSWDGTARSIEAARVKNSRLGIDLSLLHVSNCPDNYSQLQLSPEIPLISTLFLYQVLYPWVTGPHVAEARPLNDVFDELGLGQFWQQWRQALGDVLGPSHA